MKLVFNNLSELPRTSWAQFTLPTPLAQQFDVETRFVTTAGVPFRVVRGRTKGMRTTFRCRLTMGGKQRLEGTLENRGHGEQFPFLLHPWVTDDIGALIPSLGARVDGGDWWDQPLNGPVLLETSPAHQRFWLRRRQLSQGLIFEVWADIHSLDPVIKFWGKIVWSDRTVSQHQRRFEYLALRAGEIITLDFGQRHGVRIPFQDPDGMWTTVLNETPLILGDGTGLPLSGNIFAFTTKAELSQGAPGDHSDPRHWVNEGLRDLRAAFGGPIVGAAVDVWDGYWLGNKNTPRVWIQTATNAEWAAFESSLKVQAGWFADRPYGLGKTPGMTGDQDDFGATKGAHVVTFEDPRFIHAYKYCVQSELFRGTNHYAVNGVPLRAEDHPSWVTWSGGTHWSRTVSPDRLGKNDLMVPPPPSGFYGYDDQHRSQHTLAAYLMLADDPLMEDALRFQANIDKASYRIRYPNNGNDAARAQGRLAGAWANFLTIADAGERELWASMLSLRMNIQEANPSLNLSGPMKVLAWGDPDPRKAVFKPDGSLGPWVSMWEHGLAVVGLYAAAKQGNEASGRILRKVCETLAQFGFFRQDDQWYTVADLLWNNGESVPLSLSRQVVVGGGVDTWTFAGLLVAREVLGPSHPRFPILNEYILDITGGVEAADRRTAEWWAAVRGISLPV